MSDFSITAFAHIPNKIANTVEDLGYKVTCQTNGWQSDSGRHVVVFALHDAEFGLFKVSGDLVVEFNDDSVASASLNISVGADDFEYLEEVRHNMMGRLYGLPSQFSHDFVANGGSTLSYKNMVSFEAGDGVVSTVEKMLHQFDVGVDIFIDVLDEGRTSHEYYDDE